MSLFQALIAEPGVSFDLLKFSVKYRTADFSYLTSAPFSDTASFFAGSNVIKVETAVTPTTNAITTSVYMYADDPDNDRIFYKNNDTTTLVLLDRDWNIIGSLGSGSQASCYDPTTDEVYSFTGGGTNGCDVKDGTTGTHKRYYDTTFGATSGHIFYDYINQKFYAAPDLAQVQIWGFSGSSIVLQETLWYSSRDGLAIDNIFDKVVNYDQSDTKRIRFQNRSGLDGLRIYSAPITLNSEGIAVCPDGSLILADPSGYHFGVTGGNRLWHVDPRNNYKKYDRSPSMTRFDRFSGGVILGRFDTQKIIGGVGQVIYSPVYDTDGFTNTENASAWEFEFSEGGDADIEWITSNTAPTTTPKTQYDSDLPTYAGWGSTVPSAPAAIPGTDRYKQAVLTVKAATPSSLITIQDLIDDIQPQILCVMDRFDTMYVYEDTTPDNIGVIPNHATPTNYFSQSVAAQMFNFNAGFTCAEDNEQNDSEQLLDANLINADTQGQLTVVSCRAATNVTCLDMNVGTVSSSNNRITIGHDPSASGSRMYIAQWSGAGALLNKVGTPADTSINVFKRKDFISDGSAWTIKVNGVSQTLTVLNGSNNGNWFGDLSPNGNRVQIGFANALAGTIGKWRFYLYKNAPLTAPQNTLVDNFIAQENMTP